MQEKNQRQEQRHFRLKFHRKEQLKDHTGSERRAGKEDRPTSGHQGFFNRAIKIQEVFILLGNS